MNELGDRLKPAGKMLAGKIMDNTAGDIPDYGYKILAAGGADAAAILSPHLAAADEAERERAAVALGFMGPAGVAAKPRLEAALPKASTPREKLLLEWTLREVSRDPLAPGDNDK